MGLLDVQYEVRQKAVFSSFGAKMGTVTPYFPGLLFKTTIQGYEDLRGTPTHRLVGV